MPPLDALGAFYQAHPDFLVDADGTVGPAQALDYEKVLGEVERVFVQVLRTSPTGLMDRGEFEASAIGRGVNVNSFSVFTTYSPILDHPAMNVWCLRGQEIDPSTLAALREVLGTRTKQRRTIAYGWDF